MKTALTIGLLLVLAGLLWKRRRRVGLALKLGAVLYGLLMVVRLFEMRDDPDQLVNFGIGFGALIAVWLLTQAIWEVVRRRRASGSRLSGRG